MIDARLQQILDNAKHPIAKAMLRDLFENDDFKKHMVERLEPLISEQRAKVGWDGNNQVWTWEEEEELDELDVTTIERYRDRAQSQLTRGTYAKRSDNIKTASRKRMNRASGIKKANSRLNTFNNDGHDANTTNEGIGSAIGNMVKSLATSTVSQGRAGFENLHRAISGASA